MTNEAVVLTLSPEDRAAMRWVDIVLATAGRSHTPDRKAHLVAWRQIMVRIHQTVTTPTPETVTITLGRAEWWRFANECEFGNEDDIVAEARRLADAIRPRLFAADDAATGAGEESESGAYRRARGALKLKPGSDPPTVILRRLRDSDTEQQP